MTCSKKHPWGVFTTAAAAEPKTFLFFGSAQAALDYRRVNGTGGWIFIPEDGSNSILFPPDIPPIGIFHHPITRGHSGTLIGHG